MCYEKYESSEKSFIGTYISICRFTFISSFSRKNVLPTFVIARHEAIQSPCYVRLFDFNNNRLAMTDYTNRHCEAFPRRRESNPVS